MPGIGRAGGLVALCAAAMMMTTAGAQAAPTLDWATYLGGDEGVTVQANSAYGAHPDPADDFLNDVHALADGSAIVVGQTRAADFRTTLTAVREHRRPDDPNAYAAALETFVTRLTPNGQGLRYSTYLGPTARAGVTASAADGAGGLFLAVHGREGGWTPSDGAFQTTQRDGDSGIVHLTPDGAIDRFTYWGSTSSDDITGLAVAPGGDLLVLGETESDGFVTTPGLDRSRSGRDGTLSRLSPDLRTLRWSRYLGGSGDERSADRQQGRLSVTPDGDVLVLQTTTSTDTAAGADADTTYGGGPSDALATRLRPDGVRRWATYVGGSGADEGKAITGGPDGRPLLTVETRGSVATTPGAMMTTRPDRPEVLALVRLARSGPQVAAATYLPGRAITQTRAGGDVAVGASGTPMATTVFDDTSPLDAPQGFDTEMVLSLRPAILTFEDDLGALRYGTFLHAAGGLATTPSRQTVVAAGPTLFPLAPLEQGAFPAAWNSTLDDSAFDGTVVGLDPLPPEGAVTRVTASPTNDTTPTFAISANEDGVTFRCQVDGGTASPCGASFSPTLNEGLHTVRVIATDRVGNVDTTPAEAQVRVDTTPPDTSIPEGPGATTGDATPTFRLATNDPDPAVTFECQVDAQPFARCDSLWTIVDGVADGPHTARARARDAVGNVDMSPASYAFTVNTDAPETSIRTGPGPRTNDQTPAFTFVSSDPDATFACKVTGQARAFACTSPRDMLLVNGDGAYTFEVVAENALGVDDPTPATYEFVLDTVVPDTTITAGPPPTTRDQRPAFSFTLDEPARAYRCTVDGGRPFACQTGQPLPFDVAEGDHVLGVQGTDLAGNEDPTPAERPFVIDLTGPDTQITSGPDGRTTDPTPTFTATGGVLYHCQIDDGPEVRCGTTFTVATPLADGPHVFRITGTDAAGNEDPTPAERRFSVDTDAPDTFLSGPGRYTNDPTPSFTLTSDHDGVRYECKVGTAPYASCEEAFDLGPLADGTYDLEAVAVDLADGDRDLTPSRTRVIVDTVAPDGTITGPSGRTTATSVTWGLSADDRTAILRCRVDNGEESVCPATVQRDGLAEGPHGIRLVAVDLAGNEDPTPAVRGIVVDRTPPETTIASGPVGVTTSATPVFGYESSEPNPVFTCRVDPTPTTPRAGCPTPHRLAALSEGRHTIEVRAADEAGNVDPTPATREFIVDARAPQTIIDAPIRSLHPAIDVRLVADETEVTFACTLDGAALPCGRQFRTPDLPDGTYDLTATATDVAGTADPTPARHSFTIDTVAPDGSIVAGPEGVTNDATPTFAIRSTEPGRFSCLVDMGPAVPCDDPFTTGALGDGAHVLRVTAIDLTGNADPTPAGRSFSVDTTAPETAITSAPPERTEAQAVEVAFRTVPDDPAATFTCAVDGAAPVPCTSPLKLTVANGRHSVAVFGIDAAGNRDTTPAVAEWVTSPPPEIMLNQPVDPPAPPPEAPPAAGQGEVVLAKPTVTGADTIKLPSARACVPTTKRLKVPIVLPGSVTATSAKVRFDGKLVKSYGSAAAIGKVLTLPKLPSGSTVVRIDLVTSAGKVDRSRTYKRCAKKRKASRRR